MKTLFVAAGVFALMSAQAALAQEEHRPGGAGPQQHAPAGPPARQGPAPQGPVGHAAAGGNPGMGARPAQGPRPAEGAGPIRGSRVTQNMQPMAGARPEVGGHTPGGRQGGPNERGVNAGGTNGRGAPQHVGAGAQTRAGTVTARPGGRGAATRSPAVAALRRNVQASHRFHVGAYQAPAGYRARHWSHGQRLPGFLFARNFWLLNYAAYALFPPPPGLVWVRVGADALLIDQFTGEIIQVDYGVFY